MHHPQVVKSPIFNHCLEVNIDGHTRPHFFPKMLLQVSIQELHNRLVSDQVYVGLNEARYADNNIIISDSTLRSFLPPKFKCFIKIKGNVWL